MAAATRISDTFITPDGKQVDVSDLIDIYRSSCKYPMVSGARIHNHQDDCWNLTVYSSISNCDLMKNEQMEEHLMLVERNNLTVRYRSLPFFHSKSLMEDTLSTTRVILTKEGPGASDYAITWFEDGLFMKSFKLAQREEHGALITARVFSSFKLSPEGNRLMYVAEKKTPTSKSSFASNLSGDQLVGDEHMYIGDWGEGYNGIRSSVVCIFDLREDSVRVISLENWSLIEPLWISCGEVGFLAISEQPRRLGFIYAFNRPTKFYTCNLTDKTCPPPVCLLGEDGQVCLRSPRMSPDSSRMVILENNAFGPDMTSCKILLYNFKSESKKVIVTTEAELYIYSLADRCWNTEGDTIYFDSIHKCRSLLWSLNVEKGSLKRVRSPYASACFITANHGLAVIQSSSINNMPQLFACQLDDAKLESADSWLPISAPRERNHLTYKIVEVKQKVHAILISPIHLADSKSACIVLPHGGPHGASIDAYSQLYDRLVSLGFKVLLVNYCGSIGYDDRTLKKLIGNVGKSDLEDCIAAVSFFKDKKLIDRSQLLLWGSSWGGYLVCNMAAQNPEFNWVALVAKAPVTNLASLVFECDSPDFCWSVILGNEYKPKEIPIATTNLTKLYEASPIRYITCVETPSIIFVGTEDRCVPMAQGLTWHNALKDGKVPTKCHVYQDGHGLRKLSVDSDIFVNGVIWLLTHLKNRTSAQ